MSCIHLSRHFRTTIQKEQSPSLNKALGFQEPNKWSSHSFYEEDILILFSLVGLEFVVLGKNRIFYTIKVLSSTNTQNLYTFTNTSVNMTSPSGVNDCCSE